MTPHQELILNRREVEEAFENLKSLKKDGFYNVPKLTWWVLRYESLYIYCNKNKHNGSCFENMACACTDKNIESRFSMFYPSIEDIVDLFQYEEYFKEELNVLENIRHDYPALIQWLKKNEKLGTEDFILFWNDWLEAENTVRPFNLGWMELDVKFKSEEWKNTIRFCEVFNEIYWTSDACPDIEN